jgi:hypothetical protein
VAVTSQGAAKLFVNDDWGCSRTYEQDDGRAVDVPVRHPKDLPPCDILKADAEGVELEVFEHYPHLDGVRVAIYEWHRHEHRDRIGPICEAAGLRRARFYASPFETEGTKPEASPCGVAVWVRP